MHAAAPWIPGEHQIRPSPETLELKAVQMDTAERFYTTMSDFVWDLVFNFPTKMQPDGKLSSGVPPGGEKKRVFAPNEFPYQIEGGGRHYIMWYSYGPPDDLAEADVDADIAQALREEVLKHDRFEFAWYENPVMTIPGIYHVQVFWHETT